MLLHKLQLGQLGYNTHLVAPAQETPDRLAAGFAVVERPIVHVHADELVRQVDAHVAGVLQRVLHRLGAVLEAVPDAALEHVGYHLALLRRDAGVYDRGVVLGDIIIDDRRLVVDAFARWRISDAKQFRRAVGASGINGARSRLERILNAQLRGVLGGVTSGAVLSADRVALMNKIRDLSRTEASGLGVEIIDVRIKRADLPAQNLTATFERMRAEREREAADEIARGNEAAQRVRAQADRTVVETVSEAQKNSDIIRGEADAARNAIFADAFGRDPEFFAFYRSLAAYEKSLKGSNSTLVISPDSEFFDFLKSDTGR